MSKTLSSPEDFTNFFLRKFQKIHKEAQQQIDLSQNEYDNLVQVRRMLKNKGWDLYRVDAENIRASDARKNVDE